MSSSATTCSSSHRPCLLLNPLHLCQPTFCPSWQIEVSPNALADTITPKKNADRTLWIAETAKHAMHKTEATQTKSITLPVHQTMLKRQHTPMHMSRPWNMLFCIINHSSPHRGCANLVRSPYATASAPCHRGVRARILLTVVVGIGRPSPLIVAIILVVRAESVV